MDRQARHELERVTAELPGDRFFDLEGPAVYMFEPSWRSAIACFPCKFVSLRSGLPTRRWRWQCPRCGRTIQLSPPADVTTRAAMMPSARELRATRLQ